MAEIDRLLVREPALEPPAAALPPDRVRELLARLAHALEDDLGAAEPLLAQLRAGVAAEPTAAEIAAIAQLVEVFAVDEALERLRKLAATDWGEKE